MLAKLEQLGLLIDGGFLADNHFAGSAIGAYGYVDARSSGDLCQLCAANSVVAHGGLTVSLSQWCESGDGFRNEVCPLAAIILKCQRFTLQWYSGDSVGRESISARGVDHGVPSVCQFLRNTVAPPAALAVDGQRGIEIHRKSRPSGVVCPFSP